MQERISEEIKIVKKANIKYASNKILILTKELEELRSIINTKENNRSIYKECIRLNRTKDLPVNCKDVTINLKEDL
jgi:hypothetical protein